MKNNDWIFIIRCFARQISTFHSKEEFFFSRKRDCNFSTHEIQSGACTNRHWHWTCLIVTYIFRSEKMTRRREEAERRTRTIKNAESRWKADIFCRTFCTEYFIMCLLPLSLTILDWSHSACFLVRRDAFVLYKCTRCFLHQLELNVSKL